MAVTHVRVLHVQLGSSQATFSLKEGEKYEAVTGWALVGIQTRPPYSDMFDFMRVGFKQTPGGNIQEGDVEITKLELAVWQEGRQPPDGDGQPLDSYGLLAKEFPQEIGAYFRASAANTMKFVQDLRDKTKGG